MAIIAASGLLAAEAQPDPVAVEAELRRAADQVSADVTLLRTSSAPDGADTLTRASAQVQVELARLRAAVIAPRTGVPAAAAPGGPPLDALRDGLKDMEGTLGTDVLQQTLSASIAASGSADPSPEHTYRGGLDGLLWVFWSFDAPGVAQLPGQLAAVQARWPGLVIRDSHVMRISDWLRFFKKMAALKEQLEADEPGKPRNEVLAHKLTIRDAEMPTLNALTLMASTRRQGGYLLMEDMTAATAYHVATLPTLVYVSPLGLVHRIAGITPDRGITDWIDQALAWEVQNTAALRARGLIP